MAFSEIEDSASVEGDQLFSDRSVEESDDSISTWRRKFEDEIDTLRREYQSLEIENRELKVDLALAREEVRLVQTELDHWKREAKTRAVKENIVGTPYQEDYLLNSLDNILFEKQKQVYLLSGIHHVLGADEESRDQLGADEKSPDKPTGSLDSAKDGDTSNRTQTRRDIEPNKTSPSCDSKGKENESNNAANDTKTTKPMDCVPASGPASLRKLQPKLKLDLKKSYDFKPKRTGFTPTSCGVPYSYPWDSSLPSTPTPSSALRPSLSLHNLASKNFTEVLIPTITPKEHVVHPSPTNLMSPTIRSPQLLIKFNSPLQRDTTVVFYNK